jgi:hypothetical protein
MGGANVLVLLNTAYNGSEPHQFVLLFLGFCRSLSLVDTAGGQGVVGSNPAVPTVEVAGNGLPLS